MKKINIMEKKMSRTGFFSFFSSLSTKFPWPVWVCSFVLITTAQFAFSHGTVTSPPSRIWNCYKENPENPTSAPCISAVASHGTQALYDWNEINQGNANGNHVNYVQDGHLASGGRPDKYGGMDQVRSDWVATPVSPGPYTITWTISAPHATSYFDVYITHENWTPAQPLTWDNLTRLVRTPQSSATNEIDILVTLPVRTGKHVIYSVWQRSDSPEAFYSTSDIDFGAGTTSIDPTLANFALNQSYPNPSSSLSKIGYKLGTDEFVSLKVYDLSGQEVATLVNSFQTSGEYEVTFNMENLSSGMYLYRLQAGAFIETKRLILQN